MGGGGICAPRAKRGIQPIIPQISIIKIRKVKQILCVQLLEFRSSFLNDTNFVWKFSEQQSKIY